MARSAQLKRGAILSGKLGHQAYVLYRTYSGRVVALDAFCPHMGAHLGAARVTGEDLECALHACRIRAADACQPCEQVAASEQHIHRTRSWPCMEQCGLVFLHPPAASAPSLPLQGMEAGWRWLGAGPRRIRADWRAMICNGFDIAHMQVVHQRALTAPPVFERKPGQGLSMAFSTRVLPKGGLSSLLIRLLSGNRLQLRHTCIGPVILVESALGRFRTRGIFAALPQDPPATAPEDRSTLAFASVGVPANAPFARLQSWVARGLYLSFLKKDFRVVEGMRLKLDAIDDDGVRMIAAYLQALPGIDDAA